MNPVEPIDARQAEELVRILQQGGCGTSQLQQLIEHSAEVINLARYLERYDYIDPGLIEQITMVTVPPIPTFEAKMHFVEHDRCHSVEFAHIGPSFQRTFLAGDGIIEDAVTETMFDIYRLKKPSNNERIIFELDRSVVTTTLGQMWKMMEIAQDQDESTNPITGHYGNIFYIPNQNNRLSAVYCRYDRYYRFWDVEVFQVKYSCMFDVGTTVVSCC